MKAQNGDSVQVPCAAHHVATSATDVLSPHCVKKILVPVDFSDCSAKALEYASAFAAQVGASLTLLHVVEPALHGNNYVGASSAFDLTNDNVLEVGRDRLAALGRRLVHGKVRLELLVRMGRAHSEILDTMKALGADLIILGTYGQSALKEHALGSTAEKVMRHSPCPVLSVRCD